MAIKFKVVKRAQAGVKGGGTVKYQAVITGRKVIDTAELSEIISKQCTLQVSDVRGVLIALSELMPGILLDGSSVQFENIGIFSPTLDSELKDTPEEIGENTINGLRIRFRADRKLKKPLKGYDLRRAKE
ncbi:MAG: hypothetical protein WC384_13640 [Prolixibacteraceae bacterium]|jgi:predicted histone-like DNA-binding protein